MNPVPDRRVRLLQRRDFHGDVVIRKPLAVKIQDLLRQALQHELEALRIDLLRIRRVLSVIREFDGRGAAAEADIDPPAAQMIEHADFLDQPQRMMQRQRVDQRAEPKLPRALGDRGKEHAGGGRHAERRRMMLGEVIGVEPGLVVGFDELEAILVIVAQRQIVAVEVIENAEVHCSIVRAARRLSAPLGSGPGADHDDSLPPCRAETILDPCRQGERGGVLVLESDHLKPERQAFVGEDRQRDRRNAEIGRMHGARRIAGRTEAARRRTGRG